MSTQAPAELKTAIGNASSTYGVPQDILTGVWRIESGSTFPNPAVNSSGYGGLFGTKNWNASTQDQANSAASTLAYWFQRTGSWDTALHYYSSGSPTGGYGLSKVQVVNANPGQVSSGGQSLSGPTNPLDIGGAISNLGTTISNIPATIAKDTQHLAIGAGFGILAILLIVSGILIIIFTTETGRGAAQTAASAVPKVVPIPV